MSRILLIEDNDLNRDLISRRLMRRGFEVILALDGAEGIVRAGAESPHLILMDMGLPVVSGYEAARRLKADPETRDIPIIGLSARAMAGDAERASAAGCDDYDTKPIEWPRLLAKIDRLLESSADRRPRPPAERSRANPDGDGRRVLLVDPGAHRRRTLSGRLEALGHHVTLAENGRRALQRLASEPYDAVLLYVSLPDMSGDDMLRFIYSQPHLRRLPVLIVAGIEEQEQAVAALELGARDILAPPFSKPVLKTRLDAALARLPRVPGAAAAAAELTAAKRRADHLLRVLLPEPAITELRATGKVLPRRVDDVAILVLVIEDLAARCDQGEPEEVVGGLQELLLAFEKLEDELPLRRLGLFPSGVFWAVGLEPLAEDPARVAHRCARELLEIARAGRPDWRFTFGLHAGPATAALLGRRRYDYALWGETVERAHHVARRGKPGAVNVSDEVRGRLGGNAVDNAVDEDLTPDASP